MSSYVRTPLGLLNLSQLLLGPVIYFFVTVTYNNENSIVVLRMDALIIVCVAGAFFIMSLFLMTCGMMDPNLVMGRAYRTMVTCGAMYYSASSIIFTFQEVAFGTTQLGRLAVAAALFNCFSYVGSAIIAFQPAIV